VVRAYDDQGHSSGAIGWPMPAGGPCRRRRRWPSWIFCMPARTKRLRS
jgi:hypothetical protein